VERDTLAGRPNEPRLFGLAALVGGMALCTVLAGALLGGNPLIALLPVLAFVALYVLLKLPLRVPLTVMMFVGLTFENPGDVPAVGLWQSPLYDLGKLLLAQLKHSFGSGALVMTGSDLILLLLFFVYLGRRIAGSTLDTRGATRSPR